MIYSDNTSETFNIQEKNKKKKEKDATVFMFISFICDTNDFPVHDLSGVLELGST